MKVYLLWLEDEDSRVMDVCDSRKTAQRSKRHLVREEGFTRGDLVIEERDLATLGDYN